MGDSDRDIAFTGRVMPPIDANPGYRAVWKRIAEEIPQAVEFDGLLVIEHQFVDGQPRSGTPLRAWMVMPEAQTRLAVEELKELERRSETVGIHYRLQRVRFAVSADGTRVMFNHTRGPRVGRGGPYLVTDEEELEPDPDGEFWVS